MGNTLWNQALTGLKSISQAPSRRLQAVSKAIHEAPATLLRGVAVAQAKVASDDRFKAMKSIVSADPRRAAQRELAFHGGDITQLHPSAQRDLLRSLKASDKQVYVAATRGLKQDTQSQIEGRKQEEEARKIDYVDTAVQYYQGAADSTNGKLDAGSWVKRGAAKGANLALTLTGLPAAEKSGNAMVEDAYRGDGRGTFKGHAARFGFDATMVAITVIPGVEAIRGLVQGENLLRTAKAGTAIVGMERAGQQATTAVANQLERAVGRAIPEGTKASASTAQSLLHEVQGVARQYGIKVKEGGRVGESVGSLDEILVNTKVGGPHEITHVVQQVQTRASLLQAKAEQLGKNVVDLSSAERGEVLEGVQTFEKAAVNQHEMWAKQASTLLGGAKPTYGEAIRGNIASFAESLASGTIPAGPSSWLSRQYGNLPNLLGTSQAQIATTMAVPVAAVVNYQAAP